MRAGLIIGGAVMMVFGALLSITFIFLILGVIFGFVGLIMLIVGCVTSGQPKQQQVVYNYQQPAYQNAPPIQNTGYAPNQKYCGACGTPNPAENQFCARCGKRF